MLQIKQPAFDTLSVLNAIPGNHLILLPNAPQFTIIAATDSYLQVTYTSREEIIGKGMFEAFPDNIENQQAIGAHNLNASLHFVVEHRRMQKITNLRTDKRTGAVKFSKKLQMN